MGLRLLIVALFATMFAFGRDVPIHQGRLTSDLNANGFAITNLPAGFFPVQTETDPTVPAWAKLPDPPSSGGGLTTNDVCAIVTNAVDGYITDWNKISQAQWYVSGPDAIPGSTVRFEIVGVSWAATLVDDTTGERIGTGVSYGTVRADVPQDLEFYDEDTGERIRVIVEQVPHKVNALGIALVSELPDSKPVSQFLLKGEDGKTWKIWVNAASELKVTEVTE